MEYWDKRFSSEGRIWGDDPSKSAYHALKLFKRHDIKTILVPGSGYGRNSKLFSISNYEVAGIEISKTAFDIAKNFDRKSMFIRGSILDIPFSNKLYDAIYCFNVLHLLIEEDRLKFLKKCFNLLNYGGYVYFTVFSEKEKSFGSGKEIENNTFESKPGRPVHYFTRNDLKNLFSDYFIIKEGSFKEKENHGVLGEHVHNLRYIFAQKEKK